MAQRRFRGAGGLGFLVEALERRQLLTTAYAYVAVGSSLQSTEYDHTQPITVVPDQTVTFDVQIQGSTNTSGPAAPIPTGTVRLYWFEDTEHSVSIPLTGGSVNANGIATVVVSGTLSLDEFDAPGVVDSYGQQDNFVYAEYFGDSNYADTLSTGDFTEPDANGNVVTANFQQMHYAFTQQPSDVPANSPITPAPALAIEDPSGAIDTYYNEALSITTANGSPSTFVAPTSTTSGESYNHGGTFNGSPYNPILSVNAVNGVATFTDAELTGAGSAALTTPAGGFVTAATSSSFNVTEGNKLAYGQAPGDGTAKKPIQPTITVKVENPDGSVKTTDNSTVVTLATVGFTGDAPITGNTATAVNGIASFPNLTLTTPGFYQLQATDSDGDAATTSAKFKVVGDHLAIAKPPSGTYDAGSPIALTVELLDGDDKLDTNATTYALLSLNTITPGVTASLGGTIAAAFVGGVATFTTKAGPTIDTGGAYTFTVAEANLEQSSGAYLPTNTSTSVDTPQFKIAGSHLAIRGKVGKSDVGAPITLSVAYENAKNKVVTTQNGAGVTLSLSPAATANPGSAAAVLGGTFTGNFVNGIATFTAAAGPTVSLPGDYTLTASDPTSPAVIADVSNAFTVAGYHLVVQKQVKNVDIDASIPLTIALYDSKNKLVSAESSATVTLTYTALEGGKNATQTGTLVKQLTGGVASFAAASAPSFDTAGTYQFTATETGSPAVSSAASTATVNTKPVKVNGDHITFLDAPHQTSVGDTFNITPALVSQSGTRDLNVNTGTFALTLTPVTDGAGAQLTNTLNNFAPLPIAYGNAQFKNLLITQPGTFTITATQYDASGDPSKESVPRVSKPFKVIGLHVAVLTQPDDAVDPYQPIPLKFALEDAKNKVDTDAVGYYVNVTLTATRDGTGASTNNGY